MMRATLSLATTAKSTAATKPPNFQTRFLDRGAAADFLPRFSHAAGKLGVQSFQPQKFRRAKSKERPLSSDRSFNPCLLISSLVSHLLSDSQDKIRETATSGGFIKAERNLSLHFGSGDVFS
jgi:hypothetical protein